METVKMGYSRSECFKFAGLFGSKSVMSQSIPSVTTPPPPIRVTPRHLTKIMPWEPEFAPINCPWGPGFDRGWETAKLQHTWLTPGFLLEKI